MAFHYDLISGKPLLLTNDNGGGGGQPYTLPPATATTLGGIKVGANLQVMADGTLSATGEAGTPLYKHSITINTESAGGVKHLVAYVTHYDSSPSAYTASTIPSILQGKGKIECTGYLYNETTSAVDDNIVACEVLDTTVLRGYIHTEGSTSYYSRTVTTVVDAVSIAADVVLQGGGGGNDAFIFKPCVAVNDGYLTLNPFDFDATTWPQHLDALATAISAGKRIIIQARGDAQDPQYRLTIPAAECQMLKAGATRPTLETTEPVYWITAEISPYDKTSYYDVRVKAIFKLYKTTTGQWTFDTKSYIMTAPASTFGLERPDDAEEEPVGEPTA